MRLEERQTNIGDDHDTGVTANDFLFRDIELKINSKEDGEIDGTNKTEKFLQEQKTKSTVTRDKHGTESLTKRTTREKQTNKFTIGMKDKEDTSNNMLIELQKIDERNKIKVLQKAIEDSKERHEVTLQQTETSENITNIPEKNGKRYTRKNIPTIGQTGTKKKLYGENQKGRDRQNCRKSIQILYET